MPPSEHSSPPTRPESELKAAREHLQAGRSVDAERCYQRVLAQQPNCIEALVFLGDASQARGDGGRAVSLFSRASHADPSNVDILIRLGVLYQSAERFDAARYVLERASRQSAGRHPLARLSLAALLEADERPDLAMLHYFRALTEANRLGWPQLGDSRLAEFHEKLAYAHQYATTARRAWFERVLQDSADASAASGGVRVAAALAAFLDKRTPAVSDPRQRAGPMYVPDIETAPFIDNSRFDWLERVPERVAGHMDELRDCLASPASHSRVTVAAGAIRVNVLSAGVLQSEARRHAPALLSTLRELPLSDVLHHAPDVELIALEAGARFPRHYGRSNSRCWVVVNPLRGHAIQISVGGESRVIAPVTAAVVDPSFGVEYFNAAAAAVLALVFEIPHPALSPSEQQAIGALLTAVVEFESRLQELD